MKKYNIKFIHVPMVQQKILPTKLDFNHLHINAEDSYKCMYNIYIIKRNASIKC